MQEAGWKPAFHGGLQLARVGGNSAHRAGFENGVSRIARMRRRHSQRPRRDLFPGPAPDGVLQRLIARLAPAVETAGRVPARLPRHIHATISPPVRLAVTVWRAAGARPRLLRRAIVAFALCLLGCGAVLAVVVLSLMRGQPGWWRDLPAFEITENTGNRVQNELTTLITSTRSLDEDGLSVPWGMAINAEQANAWLNTKLRDWVRSRGIANEEYEPLLPPDAAGGAAAGAGGADREGAWIDQVREVQVDFNGERIAIGARILHNGSERVFSATLVPQVRRDGSLWMLAQNVQIGRLSVPASWVLPGPAAAAGGPRMVPASQSDEVDLARLPEIQAMFDAFSGREPMVDVPLLRLPDGRRVRLLSLTTRDDGMLIVTCRTEFAAE